MIDATTKLMDKFRYLEHFKNWSITLTGSSPTSALAQVEILQLSGLSALCKEQMAVLVLELLWSEIVSNQGALRYDAILLDEFQHFPFTESSALNKMLREGRKFHLQLILSSQFISNYSLAEQDALNQVAHRMFFRPTHKDLPFISRYLGEENEQEWRTQLKVLERGECVLSGNYHLAGRTRIWATPVVVRCT